MKKKKRKVCLPYSGVSMPQISSQREKVPFGQQLLPKEGNTTFQQQSWPGSPSNMHQHQSNRMGYPENTTQTSASNTQMIRYQNQDISANQMNSPVIVGESMMLQPHNSSSNISSPQQQMQQQPLQNQQPIQQIHANNQPQNIQQSSPNVHIRQHQIFSPSGQLINVQGPMIPNMQQNNQISNQMMGNSSVISNPPNNILMPGPNGTGQNPQQRIFVNGQPSEPSGPGRPNIQMVPVSLASNQPQNQRMHLPFHNQQQQYPGIVQQCDHNKTIRPQFIQTNANQVFNGFRGNCPQNVMNQQNNHIIQNTILTNSQQQQKIWQSRPPGIQQPTQQIGMPAQSPQSQLSIYERVPPLHQHTPPPTIWTDDVNRKKVKVSKAIKKRSYNLMENHNRSIDAQVPCPNIDVRQIPNENNRNMVNQFPQHNQSASSPSFMEDPSGYLAQQTALLNSTISRQTGAIGCTNYICNSPVTTQNSQEQQQLLAVSNVQPNGVSLPSNMIISQMKSHFPGRSNQNVNIIKNQVLNHSISPNQYNQMAVGQNIADSSAMNEHMQCQSCIPDSCHYIQTNDNQHHYLNKDADQVQKDSSSNSEPGTPSSSVIIDDPVTSSTYSEKRSNQTPPDSRPIQGGTVSTSNVSPIDGSPDPATPHAPTPPIHIQEIPQINIHNSNHQQVPQYQLNTTQSINQQRDSYQNSLAKSVGYLQHPHAAFTKVNTNHLGSSIVTTMASGRTVGSNTITSVLAGRANTATVSINSAAAMPISTSSLPISNQANPLISTAVLPTNSVTLNVTKSPLEMVQSVVSSIQVPHSQQLSQQISPQQVVKQSTAQGLPPGHILVSSGGQIIMANTGNPQTGVMPPPPPKLVANQSAMPPISVSPMVTNVTAAVTQVIPAVAQQVLGQQTVLVNALPAPFVLQPGVTMTMDGMTVGQNMQLPQIVTGNVIQQPIQIDGTDPRRVHGLLSPEKKKGKKRKISSQTVASMLHIAAQQNSGVVMSQQGFPQQIQMAHSPQGITTGPVMQALTIVPGKAGGPPQIVNTGHLGTQQLIASSQPTQQINLLQPVNLLNGTTGMVQNFPTIQQFIVPNLGGMVMNADGTATILQDTSNLGIQLQLQNVNGQNVLTPVQNNNMFNGGQSILAAGPAGMVIRTPNTSQGKIIQQPHSPGAQFLSPNGGQFVVNGAQFSGQLSPLVANVSPTQQVSFSSAPQPIRPNNSVQQTQQEYIQCGQVGQTLMVPCSPSTNISSSTANQQNTTFVQQNTTIVQQQTTMVSNNQQIQNFQAANQGNQPNITARTTLNVDQNFIISSNDKPPVQTLLVQRQSPQTTASYRQSVSTQTAVNQNTQSVTTNTFCQTSTSTSAGSPPDTTTHSPMASGGQSPPTADTTTHSGSTDDGLSPAPSNCSGSCSEIVTLRGRQKSCSMAMVHCVSSSEPDSADLNMQSSEHDWSKNHHLPKLDFTDISSIGQMHMTKKPTHIEFAESSTIVSGMQIAVDQIKAQEAVVSSRNFEKVIHKRKHSDTLIMETHHMHSSVFDDDEEGEVRDNSKSLHSFVTGDLVWGPAKSCPAWPGKLVEVRDDKVLVKWFGGDKALSEVDPCCLQTLTEGLDAHHRARKNLRTSRKLSSQLENAIQEAMAELDKTSEENIKKVSKSRLISSRK